MLGNTWQYRAIPGNTWQYLAIPDNFGNTWQYMAIHDNCFTILNNTKQYLPILTNSKFGICWYSFVANMIPVLLWYHHNAVLTILCQSGIITLQILTIFIKASMFNNNINLYYFIFSALRQTWFKP